MCGERKKKDKMNRKPGRISDNAKLFGIEMPISVFDIAREGKDVVKNDGRRKETNLGQRFEWASKSFDTPAENFEYFGSQRPHWIATEVIQDTIVALANHIRSAEHENVFIQFSRVERGSHKKSKLENMRVTDLLEFDKNRANTFSGFRRNFKNIPIVRWTISPSVRKSGTVFRITIAFEDVPEGFNGQLEY